MKFDMGAAWNDGMAKVRSNFSLLAVLGGVFFFLPSVLMFVAMPDIMGMMMTPGADPDETARAFSEIGWSFFALYLLVMLASLAGYAAMIALVGDKGRLSMGESILVGFKALLPLLGVLLVVLIVYMAAALLFGAVLGLIVGALSQVSAGLSAAVAIIVVLGLIVVALWLMTRLSLVIPVIVLEGIANPLKALGRSWRLTRPQQGRLLAFYALLFVAYLVVALVLFMIMGLVVAALGAPTAVGFLNGVVGALFAMLFSAILVAVYFQLAGTGGESLEQTFE